MKTLNGFIMLCFILILLGCQKEEKWEYKVLSILNEGYELSGSEALKPTSINPTESELNKLGSEGWELITSYLELETAHPNYGDEKYVTGLQPNIRPQRAVLIFKRQLKSRN